jgi:hypothetical protein
MMALHPLMTATSRVYHDAYETAKDAFTIVELRTGRLECAGNVACLGIVPVNEIVDLLMDFQIASAAS